MNKIMTKLTFQVKNEKSSVKLLKSFHILTRLMIHGIG